MGVLECLVLVRQRRRWPFTGTSHLQHYFGDGFFVFKRSEIFHTATLPISLYQRLIKRRWGDLVQAKPRLVQLHQVRFNPQLQLDRGHLKIFCLGVWLVEIDWSTLRRHVHALGCFMVVNPCDFCGINNSAASFTAAPARGARVL